MVHQNAVLAETRRRLFRLIIVIAGWFLLGSLIAAVIIAEFTLHIPRRHLRHRDSFASAVQRQYLTEVVDVSLNASDGVTLKAWYVRPSGANGASVILLHGVNDNREGVARFAQIFLQQRYSVLLPDSRAHGESGGNIATYGLRERYDVRDWAKWLQDQSHGCIYLFGESMGAAIALQASSIAPNVCAVAADSPYSDFREVALDRFSLYTGLPRPFMHIVGRPTLEMALLYGRLRYGIDLTRSDPMDALRRSGIPGLLIHGTEDRNIRPQHSVALAQVGGSRVSLWLVPGAEHGRAIRVDPFSYSTRVLQWFRSHNHVTNRSSIAADGRR